MTKNNWFTTNLNLRKNGLCEFEILINPYKFSSVSFYENSKNLAYELSQTHDKLYVCYSGGLDSEFVLKTFIEQKLPITPLLVSTSFNQVELQYALNYCKYMNIEPEIVEFTDFELIRKLIS